MKKMILMMAVFTATIFGATAQNASGKKEFNSTLKAYFNTKNALAKDNAPLAATEAKGLLASIESYPFQALSPAQQALWKAQVAPIKKAAAAISTEKDLKVQRESFWTLSSAMLKLTKAVNLNSADVYVQYCPMAKKSWLNEVEAVQNPFYGSMMYDCGEVKETISKK